MLLACPQCQRRYRLPATGARQTVRFACRSCGAEIDSERDVVEATSPREWLVLHAGRVVGPLDVRALVEHARRRSFGADALVWRPGQESWQVAGATPPLGPERTVAWWIKLDDVDPVVEALAQVLAARPQHAPTLDALGRLARAGRSARAAVLLERAAEARGDLDGLVDLLEDRLVVTDDAATRTALRARIGAAHEARGDAAAALAVYDDARRDAPVDLALCEGAVRAAQALGDPAGAVERVEGVLGALGPEADGLRVKVAEALVELGAPDRARAAIEGVSTDAAARLRLACAQALGDWATVAQGWGEIADRATGGPRAEARRAVAEARGRLGDPAGAAAAWAEVLEADADDDDALARLAGLCELHPELDAAAARLDAVCVAREAWSPLLALRVARLDRTPPGAARAAVMSGLSVIHREIFDDRAGALAWAARAAAEDPRDARLRSTHAARAVEADAVDAWVDAVIDGLDADDRAAFVELGGRMPLGAAAARFWRAVWTLDRRDAVVWGALWAAETDPAARVALIDERLEVVDDVFGRLDLELRRWTEGGGAPERLVRAGEAALGPVVAAGFAAGAVALDGDDTRWAPVIEAAGVPRWAEASWAAAAAAHPEQAGTLLRRRAAWVARRGDGAETRAAWADATAAAPDAIEGWQGRLEAAMHAIDAIDDSDDSPDAIDAIEDAITTLAALESRVDPETARGFARRRAALATRLGRLDDAVAAWTAGQASDDAEALDALIALHAQRDDTPALADALLARAAFADHPLAGALTARRARLLAGEAARDAWRVALDHGADPVEAWAALDALAPDTETRLDTLSQRIALTEGVEQRDLRAEHARLAEGAGDIDAALASWDALLTAAPNDREALTVARALRLARGEHAEAARLGRRLLTVTDDAERPALLREQAGLWQGLGESEAAVGAWTTLLAAEPDAVDALDALDALYADAPASRAAVLTRRATIDPTPTRWRAVATLRADLGDADGAIEAFDAALALDPADAAAFASAVALLDARDDHAAIADRIDVHAPYADAEQVPALHAEAAARREATGEVFAALGHACAGLRASGDDAVFGPIAERFAAACEGFVVAAMAWGAAADERDPADARALDARLMRWLDGPLGDGRGALARAERLLSVDPDDGPALEVVARVARRPEAVADALVRLHRQRPEAPRRAALARRIGALCSGPLADLEAAEEWYRAALDDAPDDPNALAALADIYAALDDRPALRAVRLAQADRAEGAAEIALRVAAARLAADDDRGADWRAVLTLDPTHAEALTALRAEAAAAARWSEVSALDGRLVEALGGEARVAALREQARVLDGRLGRHADAAEAWAALRRAEPDDAEALDALDRLYGLLDDAPALAEVLAAKLAAGPDVVLYKRLGAARAIHDRDGARAAYDAALAQAPADTEAFEAALALCDDPAERLRRIEAALVHRDDAGRRLRALVAARAAGDTAAASRHLRGALLLDPDDATLGPIADELGDPVAALAAWQTAIEAGAGGAEPALRRRAMGWALATGALEAARAHAEALLDGAPDDVSLLAAWAEACADDPAARVEALTRLHPLLDDPAARAARAADAGAIYAGPLGDRRAAATWFEAALTDRPRDPALLARLAQCRGDDPAALVQIKRRQAEAGDATRWAEAARLAEGLGDLDAAAADWTRALDATPGDRSALAAARRVALAREAWREALELGERLGRVVDEGPARDALLRSQARLWTREVRRPERAIDAWRALLHDGDDTEALEALEALYVDVDDPAGLVEVLERRAASEGPDPARWVRIGDIRHADLGDVRGALAAFDAALAADPLHGAAFERACAICAAAGDPIGELDRVEARLGRVEGDARVELHARAAALAEAAGRPESALRHWSDAMRVSGDDARCGPPVERLAEALGDWATPAAAWRAAASGVDARRRLLGWARGPLDDAAEARVWAERVLALAPGDAAALSALAETATRDVDRVDALTRLHEVVEGDARAPVARALGAHFAERDPGRAARWFEAALADAPDDADALAGLAAVHAARSAWGPLLAVRVRQAEGGDRAARAEAARLAGRLGRVDDAIEHWRALDSAEARVELDRLLTAEARWSALAEVLGARIDESAGEQRRALRARRARLWRDALDRPDRALAEWRAALEDDPDDVEALREAAAASTGDDRLAWMRRLAAALPPGDAGRIDALRAVAREVDTARAWAALLAESPTEVEAFDALEARHTAACDWAALAGLLAAWDAVDPDDARLLRLARLRDERLGDPRGAIEAYDRLVRRTPGHDAAFARLIDLLTSLDADADALRRIEARLPALAPAERVELHRRAAAIAETRLALPRVALRHICDAFVASGDEAGFAPAAARLAAAIDDWALPVATWTAAVDHAAPTDALALHLRLGSWAAGPMAAPVHARRHYRAALAIEPEHREALRALAALAEDAPSERAEALEGLLAAEVDPETRRALAVRLGDLYAGPLADLDRAVARYEIALSATPDDAEALAGLARVYAERGAWAALRAVRARQIEALDGAVRAAMRVEMARLSERLGALDVAAATWRRALDEGADADVVWRALDALASATGDHGVLAEVLAERIELAAADPGARRALHVRRARLWSERLDDREAARAEWAAVLAIDPRDGEALQALRALAETPAERIDAARRALATLAPGDAARTPLEREVARACDDPIEATAAWWAVLRSAPGDDEALDALERLSADAPARLLDVLVLRHAAHPSVGLRLRIAALREALGDLPGALADCRAALAEQADHAEAFAQARRLLVATGDGAGLLALIEARLAHVGEPAARRSLADEAARLAEQQGDRAAALRWLCVAFEASQDDAAYGDEAARLAAAVDDWRAPTACWTAAAEALAGTPASVSICLRLAGWVDDPTQAARWRAAAAESAPDDARVLRARARAAEKAGDHPELLRTLLALREQATVDAVRRDLTRRIARLLAGPLDTPDAALAEYTRLLVARPDDAEALSARVELLRRLDDAAELYAALGALLDTVGGRSRRRALLEERAALAERQGWVDAAIEGWQAVHAIDPEAGFGALETLYAADGRLAELEALLVERAAQATGAEAAALRVRAALVAEQRGDADGARAHYQAALAAEPDHPAALRALAAHHAAGGDLVAQARLEARWLARLPAEAPEAVEHWRALGRLCQGAAGDPTQAIEAWRQVRARLPEDEEALGALIELYAATGDDAALADALVERGDAGRGEARGAAFARAAELRAALGDHDGARDAWARVFALDPTDDEAFEALVQLDDAADRPLALADTLLARAEADATRRAALLVRAAEVLADRAERPGDALRVRLLAFAERPDDAVHGEAIEALAAAADDHARAAAAYGRALQRPLAVEVAVPLRMRLARWQAERLGAAAEGIAQYCAVLDRVPDHAEALARMEALRAAVGDWGALISTLSQQVARAGDDDARLAALRRLGRVQSRQPEARAAAITTWRRVRRLAPDDDEAAGALTRLYRADEKWAPLARLLEGLPPTPGRLREVAAICRNRLDDPDRALDALERARALDADDRETADALVTAYTEAKRWTALRALRAELIRRRPPAERPALLRAQAELLDTIGEADGAAEAWRALLRIEPRDGAAMAALDRIERAAGHLAPLAEDWARHVAAAPTDRAARLTLADLHTALDDPHRAIDTLRPLVEADARDREALRRLSTLYARTGDWRYCAEALDREAAASTGFDRVDRLRESARLHAEQLRDPAGAFERISTAWRLAPDDEALAAAAARLGQQIARPAALAALYAEVEGRMTALAPRGRVLRAMARLARAAGEAGEEARAWRTLRAAVDPDDDEAIDGLARLYAADEAWRPLAEVLRHREALRPDAATAAALAVVAEHLDRLDDAAAAWRRCLDRAPGDVRALRGLCDVERARDAGPALYAALDRLARVGGAAQIEARVEQARLAADRLGRPDDARRLWREVLALRGGDDPEALAALDGLLDARDDRRALIEVLERRLAAGEPAAPLRVRLAGLRDDPAAAREDHRAALRADPDCAPALWALATDPQAPERADARRRLLARLPADDARRVELLRARAHDAGPDEAITAWRALRAEAPSDVEAADALAALYEARGETAALADLLADREPARAARLYVELGRVATARRLYGRVLAEQPGDADASAALASMHEAALRWPALVEVLVGRLAVSADPDERHALRVRLATVHEARLRDPAAAFEVLCAAFAERPTAALLGALTRLAAETDGWPALAATLEDGLPGDDEPALRSALAAIYTDHLEMPQAAITHARRAWQLAPTDDASRVRLEELLAAVEDHDGLAEVWADHADRLTGDPRRALLGALARHHAERRGDPAAAIAVWQDVLAARPADAEALDALAGLHREADRLSDLCAVIERRFEQADSLDARVTLAHRIADLALDALGDPARAIGPLTAVVEAGGDGRERLAEAHARAGDPAAALAVRLDGVRGQADDDARALALLELADARRARGHRRPWRALRRALTDAHGIWRRVEATLDAIGRWDDLVELATLDAEEHGGRDRWARVARLHEAGRSALDEARGAWQVVLAAAPGDAEALDALARLADPSRLADILAAQAERLDGAARAEALRRLARLGDASAWPRLLAVAPGDLDALDVVLREAPSVERLSAALAAGAPADGIATRALWVADAMPADAIDAIVDALSMAYAIAPDAMLRDRLAMARAAAGDRDGWRALAHEGRAEADPEGWARRTIALRDLDRASWPDLADGAGKHRLAALDEALVEAERWADVVAVRALGVGRAARVEWARAVERLGDDDDALAAWRQVLATAPGDAEALAAIADLPGRVAVWVEQVAHVDDPAALALAVAGEGTSAQGIAAIEAALARVGDETALLDRLAVLRGDDPIAAADTAERALAVADPAERFERLRALATLRAEAGDLDGAFTASAAAVAAGPDQDDEDGRLARLASATGRLAERATALIAARDATHDTARAAALDDELVALHEGPLAGEAMAFWQARMKADPSDAAAFAGALRGLGDDDWRARTALFAARAAAVPGEAVGLQSARARLLAEQGADPRAAWRAVVAAAPGNDEALRALWRLAEDDDERDGLARALLARVPAGEPLRVELHRHLAPRVEDPTTHWRAIVAADADDARAATALEALRRAAGDWDEVRALLDWRLARAGDAVAEAEIWREVAGIEQRRGDAAATRQAWRAVLARRPGDPEAEAALADAHLAADDVEAWAAVRLGRLDHVADAAARRTIYREVAETLEARLPDPTPAFEIVARALAERPHDAALLDALVRLGEAGGQLDALTAHLSAALERLDGEPAVSVALQLADVEAGRHPEAAAAAWRVALTHDPRCTPALDGLEGYAERRGDDELLAEVLAARLRTPLAADEALDRWRRLARLSTGDEAARAWGQVLSRAADDREALAALVEVHRAAEAWRPLEAAIARRVELDGEAADRRALAEVRAQAGDLRGAREALRPIVDDGAPETLRLRTDLARRAGDWPAAAAALGDWARVTTGAEAREHLLDKARIEREHLDAADAMASLDAAAALDPGHRPTLEAIWSLAEAQDDAAAAARALVRLEATSTDGRDRARWLTRLGELCAGPLDDRAGAVEAWRQAVEADPTHGPALWHLADDALAAERWAAAGGLIDRWLRAEPDASAVVRRERHRAAARCAEALDDDAAARRHYEAALALDDTDRVTLSSLADLAFRQGDWARAFKVGQALLIHHGEGLDASERADRLHRLGALKALMGEAERSAGFYRQALEVDPQHAASRRALDAGETALATVGATAAVDPSWIGEAALVDIEDAALEAYLWGDGAAPPGVEGAPLFEAELIEDDDAPIERLAPQMLVVRDEGVAEAAKAATAAAAEASAAARAAEAAARAAEKGAEAMSKLPVSPAGEVRIANARVMAPARPIKGGRVRVVKQPKRRRGLYLASAASVLIAGAAIGLYAVQSWRLEATESENARLARVSNQVVQQLSGTQGIAARVMSALRGEAGEEPPALALQGGKPLDETLIDLALRDLEMREQLGAVEDVVAKADEARTDEAKRAEVLEAQVAALQAHIEGLKTEQSEVHARLASRIDQNITALETALTATGVDFDSLIEPSLGGTPMMVAGVDDVAEPPMEGVGGPFIAEGTRDYVNPIPGETEVMSGFGPRGHSHHNGIDIPAPLGTAVLAVSAGEIIHVQDRAAWQRRPKFIKEDGKTTRSKGWRAGVYVELKQDDGRISRYMHLSALAPVVEVGARVDKGQVLGSVGRTGVEVSETHLHFELREPADDGGRFGAALDPTAAVHADDVDVVVGTSLLHIDPTALDPASLDAETRKRLRARVEARAEDGSTERLDGRMDRLQSLEKLLREMPLVPPVDELRVSSPFGRRLDPIEGEWGFHGGLDIPGAEGTAIRATAPGTVTASGMQGRYGMMVEIDHGNGIVTRYGHLLRSLVRVGDRVRYREKIGEMGSSGRSTGTHLHYEVRVDGKPRDPMNFIQAGRYVFKR